MGLILAIFLVISGLMLIGDAADRLPGVGKSLAKARTWLTAFAIFVGILDVVLALVVLF